MLRAHRHRRLLRCAGVALACVWVAACGPAPAGSASTLPASAAAASSKAAAASAARTSAPAWVTAARAQIGVTVRYDPAYVPLAYPGGDVPRDRGVCTDVVIRALRGSGLDLQQQVHEDMRAHFPVYPQSWGLRGPDRSIDHRRVPNLQRWFERQGWREPVSLQAADYRAGDLVTWMVDGDLPHIGIVSDRRSPAGTPLVIHNIGAGTREEDALFGFPITGHYRPAPADQPVASARPSSSRAASTRE